MWIKRTMEGLWAGAASRHLVRATVVVLVLLQIAAVILPQIPVPTTETAAYNRRLAELQPMLGKATRPLASLGLLTIRGSLLLRFLLACLALIAAANLDQLRRSTAAARWSRSHLARLTICLGSLLMIGGWAAQMLWGWQDPEVIAWPGADLVLPERQLTFGQPTGPIGLAGGRYGVFVIARGERTGLEATATDADGRPLQLLPSVNEAPQDRLQLAFTSRDPEAFFAVPTAGLIVRLNQIAETVQMQAYRSASGDLLAETTVPRTASEAALEVDGAVVFFQITQLPRYEVIYNPGALAEVLGLGLLVYGAMMLESSADQAQDGSGADTTAAGDKEQD